LSVAGYVLFGHVLHREEFAGLASTYVILFAAYLFVMRRNEQVDFSVLLSAAILFRLTFLFSMPRMSDDYVRFIWDGTLSVRGINPYAHLPADLIQQYSGDDYLRRLFAGMNSPTYYSVYPPVLQWIFALAAWMGAGNLLGAVVTLRLVCLCAETGSLLIIRKLLQRLSLPQSNLLWYALNPLVIIELSGNLHFEAVMIFFLLLAVYLLFIAVSPEQPAAEVNGSPAAAIKKSGIAFSPRFFFSSVAFGLSIATKLVPLLFLPFLIKRLGWKNSVAYFGMVGLVVLLSAVPFIDRQLMGNLGSSLDLYFRKFEFNASIYYIIRWIGFEVGGYNIIQSAGPWLAAGVFVLVMVMMVTEKKITAANFFFMAQWALAIFLLLSTTVHPWYLTTLVMFSVFTEMKFAVVWSLVVMLTYATYQTQPYQEHLWLTVAEYVAVGLALLAEVRGKRSQPNL
jgi:hypothetical protein